MLIMAKMYVSRRWFRPITVVLSSRFYPTGAVGRWLAGDAVRDGHSSPTIRRAVSIRRGHPAGGRSTERPYVLPRSRSLLMGLVYNKKEASGWVPLLFWGWG